MAGVSVGGLRIGVDELFVIAGPCVIESADMTLMIAREMARICSALSLPYIFKASFDKANRTSIRSFRGPGPAEGLAILAEVKRETKAPVLTDIHLPAQAELAAEVADCLQIPAFLCRQTDLLVAAGRTSKAVNIKKGQFLAPWDMRSVVDKVLSTGNSNIILTERGSCFGYNALVVDMRSIPTMKEMGLPVVMDGTHSVQAPGALGEATGGDREMAPTLCRAAVAAGADGVFLEVHPDPDSAKSDAANSISLDRVAELLAELKSIKAALSFTGRG